MVDRYAESSKNCIVIPLLQTTPASVSIACRCNVSVVMSIFWLKKIVKLMLWKKGWVWLRPRKDKESGHYQDLRLLFIAESAALRQQRIRRVRVSTQEFMLQYRPNVCMYLCWFICVYSLPPPHPPSSILLCAGGTSLLHNALCTKWKIPAEPWCFSQRVLSRFFFLQFSLSVFQLFLCLTSSLKQVNKHH